MGIYQHGKGSRVCTRLHLTTGIGEKGIIYPRPSYRNDGNIRKREGDNHGPTCVGSEGRAAGWGPGAISTAQAQPATVNEQSGASSYVSPEAIYQTVHSLSDGEIVDAKLFDLGGRVRFEVMVIEPNSQVDCLMFAALTGARL